MTEYRVDCFFDGVEIGALLMEYVYDQEAAQKGDRGWFANHGIEEQMAHLGIPEAYPAALIRRIEIHDDHRRKGLGTVGHNHLLNLARENGCNFVYAIVETMTVEQMQINHKFYDKMGWSLFHEKGGEIVSPPFENEVLTMGYKNLVDDSELEVPKGFSVTPYELPP